MDVSLNCSNVTKFKYMSIVNHILMMLYHGHINCLLLTILLSFRKVEKSSIPRKTSEQKYFLGVFVTFHFHYVWTVVLKNKSLFWRARTHLNEVLAHSRPSPLCWKWLWRQGDSGLENVTHRKEVGAVEAEHTALSLTWM